MASLEEEIRQIERALERIMFDEVIKEILGNEVKKCAALHFEDAYKQVFLKAFSKVAYAVDAHVSFKHIFDSNCRRLGLYERAFIQKLSAILDDRVKNGIEVIPGGWRGTNFDIQLRFSLVKFCRGDGRHDRELFLRSGLKAEPQAVPISAEAHVDGESLSDKDESAMENVDLREKEPESPSPNPLSSTESSIQEGSEMEQFQPKGR